MQIQPLGVTSPLTRPISDTSSVPARGAAPEVQGQHPSPTAQRVEAAVSDANRSMKAIDAAVQFEVDPETRKTVIKVVDTNSNTVLRQVPAQEMLDIAHALDRMQGVLLRQKA